MESFIKFETNRNHTHSHYLLSVEMEELFPLLSKVNASITVWILFPLKGFGPPIFCHSWIICFSFSNRLFSSTYTHPLVSPGPSVPLGFPLYFLYALSLCLHLFIPLQWVFCSFMSQWLLFQRPLRFASMLPNAMVTSWAQFIQPLSDSENSELSQASLSSEDTFFLSVPMTPHSPSWFLLLMILRNPS